LRDAVRAGTPILLVAGSEGDEIDVGRTYRDTEGAAVELWELPDTGHTDAITTHADDWEARVTAFLEETLG
jgi:hypothetical protein